MQIRPRSRWPSRLRARRLCRVFLLGAAACVAVPPVFAQAPGGAAGVDGAAVYQAKCSLCHDSGAGAAPRLTHPQEWRERLGQSRAALYQAALQGKPNTAMAAKGGFAELSEPEVRGAVDFMLGKLAYVEGAVTPVAVAPSSSAVTASTAAAGGPADDGAIIAQVRAAYAASNGAVSTRVQVESIGGVVTLKGMVRDADQIKRAEELARAVPGVKNVDNKLVSATVFQWD